MNLLQQPPETLDACARWIDDPRDLSNMALACRKLAAIVHPWHTQYRHIRCQPYNVFVWKALVASPAFLRNVRVLEISQDRQQIPYPARPQQPTWVGHKVICMETLIAAVKEMWHLKSFTWGPSPPLKLTLDGVEGRDLWTVLSSFKDLTHLKLSETRSQPPFFIWGSAVFTRMSSLVSFTYHSDARSSCADIGPLGDMLRERCPDLEYLDLMLSRICDQSNPPFHLDSHILSGRWHALKSVRFTRGTCSVDAAISFFEAHPLLIEVYIDWRFTLDGSGNPVSLPRSHGLLSTLRKLQCNLAWANYILTCPCNVSRPIEWLYVTDAAMPTRSERFYDLLAQLTTLKTVHVSMPPAGMIHRVAESAPWIQQVESYKSIHVISASATTS